MLEVNLITKQAFQAIGLRWDGTFQGAAKGEIRELIAEFKRRLNEISGIVIRDRILGFSEGHTKEGFTYFVMVETLQSDEIPDGMTALSIPTYTYAVCEHQKGMNIDKTYEDLAAWYSAEGYELVPNARSFETYPFHYNPLVDEPEFCVYNPVQLRKN
ncbi:GyrI-like domain-containing protein [Paenibacillus ginsengarvi]|uniref:AraC family transcriptional regulator n=1 Tax=Paenibacillus ginsengarvi TaxID=400777 RepID=A0A3B0BXA6_9BACL|nr:GyrI-like domain-containing protein [Paenibacillus ginsengarvi]RKN77048.1 AraC family transcriptional regulator [Paenibacillus ginsengarvi]